MRNNNHEWLKRCFNCMEPIDEPDAVCTHCGWDNHNRKNGNAALEQMILKDQYVVGKRLGRGGFGITYVGFDLALERRIAIKEYFPIGTAYRLGDAVTVRAFTETEGEFRNGLRQAIRESRTTAKLGQIPNVMQVHNVFLENGTVYMIMEYIDGVSLSKEVKRNGKLNWKKALHLMYPIMDALEKIHEQGLIHRDISPENIIRRKKTGEPVLLDFGSARPPKEGLTVMLKPGYAPIEQYSSNSEQDGRVDEYALCATMYYLVTGTAPVSADLRQFAKKELKRPSELAVDIPAEFEKVLLKGMEPDSSNRYPSVRELYEAFWEAEKVGTGEGKGSGGAKGVGNSGKYKNSRDSRGYRSYDAPKGSANSTKGTGYADRINSAGSGSRKPEKEVKNRKIAGVIAAVAVVCLGGFLLFGNASRDKRAEKDAVERSVEEEAKTDVEKEATPTSEPIAMHTPTPEPTATATPEPTATLTPTPELTSTPTPTPEPTFTPTQTPEPTSTPTPTPEPTATNTPTPVPTEILVPAGPPRMRSERDVDYNDRDKATVLGSKVLRSEITELEIKESLTDAPSTAWDVSEAGDGSVLAWVTETLGGKKLTIAGEGGVSAPEDSSDLFGYYNNMQEADLHGLDTTNVTDMSGMFYYCTSLKSLDVSHFDTKNVTDMSGTFSSCISLTSLDVSNFDTTNVTSMSSMFSSCTSLASLDVSNFDTANVTDMSFMFYSCASLISPDVSDFDTTNVMSMSSMFYSCTSLISPDVSDFDTTNVTDMSFMFYSCTSMTSLDVSNFDTTNVTDMSWMFYSCTSMTSLDVSNFDTTNVTDMSGMFYSCTSMTSLDVSNFDTANVTSMRSMFCSCTNLPRLNVSSFDTKSVTDMSGMFSSCTSLTSPDVSNFDTTNVTDMNFMFYSCTSMTSLDVSRFDTINVTDMSGMFYYCERLTSLDVSNFDTTDVTSMSCMFCSCESLTSLDVSRFDTTNVKDLSFMFCSCESLTSLDVSNFDTTNVTDMNGMFQYCENLTSIGTNDFDTSQADTTDMFDGCEKLWANGDISQ